MLRVLLFLCAAMNSSLAIGCSCISGTLGARDALAEMLQEADAVTLATATEVTPTKILSSSQHPDGEVTQFKSAKIWKGKPGDTFRTKIITSCCMCGVSFQAGETYLLFLYRGDEANYYRTNSCVGAQMKKRLSQERKIELLNELTNTARSQ